MIARLLCVLLLGLTVAGCASNGPADGGVSGSPSPGAREVRIEAIRDARQKVGQPASGLAGAADQLVAAVADLREDPPRRPDQRLAATQDLRTEVFPSFDEALSAARDVEIGSATEDVAAAGQTWSELVDAAEELRRLAIEDLDAIERAARYDQRLSELTQRWDEPGSRRQQLEAFDQLIEDATSLADEIAEAEPVAACLGTFERRAEAARTVAERTAELRDLVQRYHGTEFDELRSEYRQDPFGLGQDLTEADAAEHACWQSDAPLVAARERIGALLEQLEADLNPDDLS